MDPDPSGYVLQGATVGDAWSNLAVVLGSSELLRSELPQPTFARWVRVLCQGSGDLRLWEFQVKAGQTGRLSLAISGWIGNKCVDCSSVICGFIRFHLLKTASPWAGV